MRGEVGPRPMISLPANDVIRQPEQLLVGEATNLLDLGPSQKPAFQGGAPVVTLQNFIALQGIEEEGDRCGRPTLPLA